MGTFSDFLEQKKITPPMIVRASTRLEAAGNEGRTLLTRRAAKRRTEAQKSYADAAIAKPKTNRGLSAELVHAAVKDQPLPRKVRAKMVRAVTALLSKKGGGELNHKALFGDIVAKKGAKVEKAAQV